MINLNQYQLNLISQNLKQIKQIIAKNQQQIQTTKNELAKDFLSKQIQCLKKNADYLQNALKTKTIEEEKQ